MEGLESPLNVNSLLKTVSLEKSFLDQNWLNSASSPEFRK